MKFLTQQIVKHASIPVGVSVLWNSFEAGFKIAKASGGKYIRIPVFVDKVDTAYGRVVGEPDKVLSIRESLGASNILIFTDIQVKHSKLLNLRPIEDAAMEAVKKGSDGLIITGKWTGDSPKINYLESVRKHVGSSFPIIIGSGATKHNIGSLMKFASGVIVGTSIKDFKKALRKTHVNLVEPYVPISLEKSKSFAQAFRIAVKHRIADHL